MGDKANVLIVDFENTYAEVYKEFGDEPDYEMMLVSTTEEALAAAYKFKPKVIVIDLPKVKNSDKVYAMSQTMKIPLVCATAFGSVGDMKLPENIRYVGKPFKAFDLTVAVRIALRE